MTKETTLSDVMTTMMMTPNKTLSSAVMTTMTKKKFANEFLKCFTTAQRKYAKTGSTKQLSFWHQNLEVGVEELTIGWITHKVLQSISKLTFRSALIKP